MSHKCSSLTSGVQSQNFIIGPEQGPILFADIIEKGVAMPLLVRGRSGAATENGQLDTIYFVRYPVSKGLLS